MVAAPEREQPLAALAREIDEESGREVTIDPRPVDAYVARRGELPAGTDPRAVSDMLSALFWGLGFHAGFLTPGTPAHNAPEVARQLLDLLDGGLLNGSVGAPSAT